MRKLTESTSVVLLAAALIVCAAGCKRKSQKVQMDATEEAGAAMATTIHVADPNASVQLIKGFHDVEQNAWRWTMKKFSVTLRPPAGAAQRGAMLRVQFAVPDPVIAMFKSVTLSASVEGVPLHSQTYSTTGDQVYAQEVPAKALSSEAVVVDFTLDKAIPPGDTDKRELGIVVSTIGFEVK